MASMNRSRSSGVLLRSHVSKASSKNTAEGLSASWYRKSSPSVCQVNGSCWNTDSAEDTTTR